MHTTRSVLALLVALLGAACLVHAQGGPAEDAEDADPPSDYDYFDDYYGYGPETEFYMYRVRKASPTDESTFGSMFNWDADYDYGYEQDPVISAGNPEGFWLSCDPQKAKTEDCYAENEFTDRIDFEFQFGSAGYAFGTPTVKAVGGSAKPAVDWFDYDLDDGIGSISVLYGCEGKKDEVSTIILDFQVTDDLVYHLAWIKKCHVESGTDAVQIKVEYLDEIAGDWRTFEDGITVPDEDPSTSFFITLLPPANQLGFDKPSVVSSNPKIIAELRGAAYAGFLSLEPTDLSVSYTCKEPGTAEITLTIPLVNWKSVVLKWKKTCADHSKDGMSPVLAGAADEKGIIGFTIGTFEGGSDVFSNSVVANNFKAAFKDLDKVDPANPVGLFVPANQSTASFHLYFDAAEGSLPVIMDEIALTVGDPSVLAAKINSPYFQGYYVDPLGDELQPGEYKLLVIRFVCRRKGVSKVLVSLNTLRVKNIEFVVTKECRMPRRVKESGFLLTAGSFMRIILFFSFAGAAWCFYSYRKRKVDEIKYSAVAAV